MSERAESREISESTARRDAIVVAATTVFLRYGFKKTSMDDLARAAGLSRQGLYLHFSTKEALFKDAVLHVVKVMRDAGRASLAREDVSVEERIVGAFEAAHAHMIGQPGSENMNELLETAAALVGPIAVEVETDIIGDVARVLRSEGVAAAWKSSGVSAKDLAENLYATSYGLKHRAKTQAEYRAGMRVAVKIVCAGSIK